MDLKNIDLKCFDVVYNNDMWGALADGDEEGIKVALVDKSVVGFCVYGISGRSPSEVSIYKLGVLPRHRGKGVARALLNSIVEFANVIDVDTLELLLPEELVTGGQDAASWLKAMGFRAECPFVNDRIPFRKRLPALSNNKSFGVQL